MPRSASILLVVLLLTSVIHAQDKNANAPTTPPGTAQGGDVSDDSWLRCGPSVAPEPTIPLPKGSTVLYGFVYGAKCATIENARVILVGAGDLRIVESNVDGEFIIIDPPTHNSFCSLIVEKNGFKTAYIFGIQLEQFKKLALRVPLEVGPSTETNPIGANAD